jgi:hypothetical protein
MVGSECIPAREAGLWLLVLMRPVGMACWDLIWPTGSSVTVITRHPHDLTIASDVLEAREETLADRQDISQDIET